MFPIFNGLFRIPHSAFRVFGGLFRIPHSAFRIPKAPAAAWMIAVFLAAFVAYGPALFDHFVFDDVAQVQNLAPAKSLGDWLHSATDPWWPLEKHKNVWRPLTRMAILAEKSITLELADGGSTWFYHLVSILLHGVASVMVVKLARDIGLGWNGAGFAGLLCAVHPLRSEAVHQIVGQAELLAAIFMLGGLILYLRSLTRGNSPIMVAGTQLIMYLCALGSKEHAILYPAYVLLLELAMMRSRGPSFEANPRSRIRILYFSFATFALICGFFLWGKFAVTGGLIEGRESVPEYENELAYMEFRDRLPNVVGILAYAVSKVFIPIRLSPDYSGLSLPFDGSGGLKMWPMIWPGLLMFSGLLVSSIENYKRRGRAWALIAAGLLSFFIVSNAFFTVGVSIALRLWYFPFISIAIGFGGCFDLWESFLRRRGSEARPMGSRLPYLTVTLIATLLLSSTWKFAPAWRTDFDFAQRTLEIFPWCWRAHLNLSREYYHTMRDFDWGLLHAENAVQIRPEAALSWYYVGLNAGELGGHENEAEKALWKAIALDPKLTKPYDQLARLLEKQNRTDEARKIREQKPLERQE